MSSAVWAGSESTVSAPIIAAQRPDLPILLEPKVNLCPPLSPQYSRCRILSTQSLMSIDKSESDTRGSDREDLQLNRIRGGGDLQCKIPDKATEYSFTDRPNFTPYSQTFRKRRAVRGT